MDNKQPTEKELIDKNIKETFVDIYKTLDKLKADIKLLSERCDNLRFLMDKK